MNTPKIVPEEFLQYIWENNLFFANDLKTVNGEHLEIINVGKRNTDSGPDFFNAKIKIDDTIWVGNIEIHKNASDWTKHNHQTDKATWLKSATSQSCEVIRKKYLHCCSNTPST